MTAATADATRPARRIPASPYARRLARERGIALDGLTGSGPRGRIVAADIAPAIPAAGSVAAPDPSVAAAPATRMPAAIAGTVPMAPLDDLIARIAAAAGRPVARTDALLRATALALRAAGLDGDTGAAMIGIEPGAAVVPLGDVLARPVGAGEGPRDADDAAGAAGGLLSLRIASAGAFVPTLLPLRDGFALRLTVTPAAGPAGAGVLLCFDAAQVSEDAALRLLEALADLLDNPLALFV